MVISQPIRSICDAIVMTVCVILLSVYLLSMPVHHFSIVLMSIRCAHISSTNSLRYGAH